MDSTPLSLWTVKCCRVLVWEHVEIDFLKKVFKYILTINDHYIHPFWPGSVVAIATGYGLDGLGIESQWGEIFRTCPDRPWGPPSLLYNGYRVFPGCKERPGRDADPSALLVPLSRKSRVVPLLPLWAVRPLQNLSACTRVHFTFYLYSQGHVLFRESLTIDCFTITRVNFPPTWDG